MSADLPDSGRRKFLTITASVVGGVGLACASIPFLSSWLPSAKTKALGAPVEVDVSKLEPGQKITVSWRGQPVFIVHRTPESIKTLDELIPELRDPQSLVSQQPSYAKNLHRAIKEQYFVMIGICTHLGCVPVFQPEPGTIDKDWKGGFFCPCHGSKYDIAGRVYKGVPAPTNMPIPPYKFLSDQIILIGEDTQGAA
ncbi:MAG: ubiquinol-cytochrome c reductase iron-sulfur subunit [Gammaproteobacteria bacterium]